MDQRNGFNSEETIKKRGEEEEQAKRVVQYIGQSNKEEQHKILCMRDFVEKRDPSSKEVDNSMLRRFLRARDQDIDKASAMFLKYRVSSSPDSDCICGKEATERSSARRHRGEPASGDLWRQAATNSYPR